MKTSRLFLVLSVAALMVPISTRAQSAAADVVAIKAVVEKETTSWFNHDPDGMIDYWANLPEAGQLVTSPEEGAVSLIQNTKMNIPIPTIRRMMADMGPALKDTYQNTDYMIRVRGNAAFAQFEQVVTASDGQKQHAHEIRYLEKVTQSDGAGQWKIVHIGTAFYKP